MAQPARSRRRRSAETTAAVAEAPSPARTLIELPPVLPVGEGGGLQELQIFGRVTATDPIEEVAVYYDSAVAGRTSYPPVALPDSRYGFAATLIRRPTDMTDPWKVEITASRANIECDRAEFVLTPGPEPSKALVQSGSTAPGITATDPLPPVIIHIDRASLGPAQRLVVEGWVLALAPLAEVRVFADHQLLGAARLGLPRTDVAKWRPEFPSAAQSGFELTIERELPPSAVHIRALATAGGLTHETARPLDRTAPASPARPDPPRTADSRRAETDRLRHEMKLHCDVAELAPDGQLIVIGWAVSPAGITAVGVVFDGVPLGDAEFGLARLDVGDQYITVPMARYSGFRCATVVQSPGDDGHEVRLIARNALGDARELVCPVHRAEPAPPPAHPDSTQFRVEIDSPPVLDGVVAEPVSGRLTIEGWVVCRPGIDRIDVFLDGQALGDAHYGIARQDVARVCPDWPQAARSGFAFHCPPRLLRNGEHSAELRFKALNGESLTRSFRFEVSRSDDVEDGPTIRRRIARVEADAYAATLARVRVRTRFRLALRLRDPDDRVALVVTLQSLRQQIYDDWQMLVVVEQAWDRSGARAALSTATPELLGRIEVVDGTRTSWPGSEELAERTLICLLSPGDELGADALAEIAIARGDTPHADVFYADEIRISPASGEREPFFKPAFSPELLRSTNYIGHPWFATLALLRRAGISPSGLSRDGDYNAVLRCTELARSVVHVPKLLCRRGPVALDAPAAEQRALAEATLRLGFAAEVMEGRVAGTWRLQRSDPPGAKISIVIPTCARGGHIETCIRSARAHSGGHDVEIICIENIPPEQEHWRDWLRRNADRVIRTEEAFNWSHFNNQAVTATSGEYLLFLNDDIEIEQADWLDAMLQPLASPDVAVVGARLLYPDRSVQHGGMFLGKFGIGRHAFRFAREDEPGYFGLALTTRNVIAVTGACMMMRRSHFDELGGFDESHPVINNDLDFCLRTHAAGRRIVYTPHASLIHHELASRATVPETFDREAFATRWRRRFAKGDPFHNSNLSRVHDDIRPNEEPVHVTCSGHPLFAPEEIRRILVVKVDHIGDFITALPAIRRLQSHFPAATLHILASPSVRGCLALEPGISELIPFEFFHARSALGQKELTAQELNELRDRLLPYRFDLAIDLRKHPETRILLRATGARFLAGFDYAGQFPWLDVTLEWERDRGLQSKRRHITDDLLHLVDAVATSATMQRDVISSEVLARLHNEPLPPAVSGLFIRPVVCVHPGAGNEMKQWPADHFVALIELLVQECSVNVLLIGGPDETEISRQILDDVHEHEAVRSVVGQVPLSGLAQLLADCALFVGNDSGPKHLAAAVGIPTIGIHSGTVDPTEWAPVGPSAVAIARKMTCSPCYLNHIADCPRELACMRQLDPGAVFNVCRRFLMARDGEG